MTRPVDILCGGSSYVARFSREKSKNPPKRSLHCHQMSPFSAVVVVLSAVVCSVQRLEACMSTENGWRCMFFNRFCVVYYNVIRVVVMLVYRPFRCPSSWFILLVHAQTLIDCYIILSPPVLTSSAIVIGKLLLET